MVAAQKGSEVAKADALLVRVGRLCDRSERLLAVSEEILTEARQAKNGKVALEAIRAVAIAARELRGHFTLLGQLSGELKKAEQRRVNVVIILPPPAPPDSPASHLAPKGSPAPTADQPSSKAGGEVIDVEPVSEDQAS